MLVDLQIIAAFLAGRCGGACSLAKIRCRSRSEPLSEMLASPPEVPVGRAPGKLLGQSGEIDAVAPFKSPLTQEMLLGMMSTAQADRVMVMRA